MFWCIMLLFRYIIIFFIFIFKIDLLFKLLFIFFFNFYIFLLKFFLKKKYFYIFEDF